MVIMTAKVPKRRLLLIVLLLIAAAVVLALCLRGAGGDLACVLLRALHDGIPGEFRVRSAVSTEEPPSLEFSAPKEAGDIAEKARKRLDSAITDMLPAALKASRALVAEVENAVGKAGRSKAWCAPRARSTS